MSAEGVVSPRQFSDGQRGDGLHTIMAEDHRGNYVGHIHFAHYGPDPVMTSDPSRPGKFREMPGNQTPQDGVIASLDVEQSHQRRGVATELVNRAKAINPNVHHNTDLSDAGKKFAAARPI